MKTTERNLISYIEVFGFYLVTGAACLVLGVALTSLMEHYHIGVADAANLSAAFALGRVLAVFIFGYLTDRIGPRIIFLIGVFLELVFFVTIPLVPVYQIGLIAAVLGGIGMSAQDTTNPLIVSALFPEKYPSMMSIGQAFFGLGCLLPPMIRSILLPAGISFAALYYFFAGICVVMLALLPFFKLPQINSAHLAQEGGHARNTVKLRLFFTGVGMLVIVCAAYCAATNTLGLYTSAFAETLPIPVSLAANMLTFYNIGTMAGSFANAAIMKKLKPVTVLWLNASIGLAAVCIMTFADVPALYFAGMGLMGFCLGPLYSVVVVLATGIFPAHAAMAAAGVAVTSAAADALNPVITGRIVEENGVRASLKITIVLLIVTAAAAFMFRALYSENSLKRRNPDESPE